MHDYLLIDAECRHGRRVGQVRNDETAAIARNLGTLDGVAA